MQNKDSHFNALRRGAQPAKNAQVSQVALCGGWDLLRVAFSQEVLPHLGVRFRAEPAEIHASQLSRPDLPSISAAYELVRCVKQPPSEPPPRYGYVMLSSDDRIVITEVLPGSG